MSLKEAQARYDRADIILKKLGFAFVLFLIALTVFLTYEVVTVQNTIANNQIVNAKASADRFKRYTDDNATQHETTQKYVRCIANVLLLPLDQRTEAKFNDCSNVK